MTVVHLGRRTALAAWLTDPKNPLVARVMVNRIWNYNFDRGIAATPGDFGLMGSRPTHPELLDYLATAFVENAFAGTPSLSSFPSNASTSAFNIAAPAAPRMVL